MNQIEVEEKKRAGNKKVHSAAIRRCITAALIIIVVAGAILLGVLNDRNLPSADAAVMAGVSDVNPEKGGEDKIAQDDEKNDEKDNVEENDKEKDENNASDAKNSEDDNSDAEEGEINGGEQNQDNSAVASSEEQGNDSSTDENSGVKDMPIMSDEIDPSKPMIAITFDDGPCKSHTLRILNVLEAVNGRATFFVVGSRITDFEKETISKMEEIGCQIGNHSYDHTSFKKLSAEGIKEQIENTNSAVETITGYPCSLVRLPYGASNQKVKDTVEYPMIQWNIDTEDWKSKDADKVVDHIKNNVSDGCIILMHDLYSTTADACEVIIPWLVEQGYQLVTVSELMEAKGITMEAGKIYYSAK